ncbi:MAG: flagellar hook-associated protein FlgL [Acidobacteriia bacterium]|nr:flagellar hook-associated protein FlgL [Terriglobia bacterium]
MTLRINPDLTASTLFGLQQATQREADALTELSSGKRVNAPSDDPAATASVIGVHAGQQQNDTFKNNVSDVRGILSAGQSALDSVVSALNQAISYGTQGGDATLSSANRQVLANQVLQVRDQVLALANTTYQGNYIFSGTQALTQPYVVDTNQTSGVAFQGNDGVNQVEIAPGQSIATNVPGDQIFSSPSADVFQALNQLSTALQSNGDIKTALAGVQSAFNQVTSQRVFYGNALKQLDSTDTYLDTDRVNLSQRENDLIGVDLSAAVVQMQQATLARQAALSAASSISQLSLLDFLK